MADSNAIKQARSQQEGGSVPIIAAVPKQAGISREEAAALVEAGVDGLAVPLDRLNQTAASFSGRTDKEALNPVRHHNMTLEMDLQVSLYGHKLARSISLEGTWPTLARTESRPCLQTRLCIAWC